MLFFTPAECLHITGVFISCYVIQPGRYYGTNTRICHLLKAADNKNVALPDLISAINLNTYYWSYMHIIESKQ